jgi:DNA-binding MarR family transcriptional regulator
LCLDVKTVYLNVKMNPADDHVARVIAQWAEVRPDLDLAPLAVIGRLGRAARYVDQAHERFFAEHDLTRADWDVLAGLRRAGPPYRLSPTDLYTGLMRASGTITHRLQRLEKAGLIRRVPHPADRRGMLVELTKAGLKLVDRLAQLHLDNEERMLEPLGPDEREELASLLAKLLDGFERRSPHPRGLLSRKRQQ